MICPSFRSYFAAYLSLGLGQTKGFGGSGRSLCEGFPSGSESVPSPIPPEPLEGETMHEHDSPAGERRSPDLTRGEGVVEHSKVQAAAKKEGGRAGKTF